MKSSGNKKLSQRILRILSISVIFIFSGIVIHYLSSMEPTIMPGSRIIVNKLIFGPRIYTDFKFEEGYYRIAGLHEELGNVKYQEILSNSYSNILRFEPSLFPRYV